MFDHDAAMEMEAIELERMEADIEMADMIRLGRALDALRAKGVCVHDSSVGLPASGEIFYPEQIGLIGTQIRCTAGCGEVFADYDAWVEAMQGVREWL